LPPTSPHHPCLRARCHGLLAGLLLTTGLCQAAPPCATEPQASVVTSPAISTGSIAAADPSSIEISSAGADVTDLGDANLKGPVELHQGTRTLTSEQAIYNATTHAFSASGTVQFKDPKLTVSGTAARWQTEANSGQFDNASFELPSLSVRGHADSITLAADGNLRLQKAEYSACPADHPDWQLRANSIAINQHDHEGVARNVRLDFMGLPILYLPIISFPVGEERKSGFLFPVLGDSSRKGLTLVTPYYLNIAANMDATLMPGFMAKRGATIGSEFRFLTSTSSGEFHSDWLPHDTIAGRDRSLLRFFDKSDLFGSLRFDTNIAYASDSSYFQDFAQGPEGTSIPFLTRSAKLTYLDNYWHAIALVEQFQTIDQTLANSARPYTRAPEVAVDGRWNNAKGLGLEIRGEAVNFTRDTGLQGGRFSIEPSASWLIGQPGEFIKPTIGWRSTRYALRNDPGMDSSPSVSMPIATVDSGLIFERDTGKHIQTIEPRMLYTYIPYRDQSKLPSFDTSLPDLNMIQLFRSERFAGGDRLGDANQLAIGETSRLVDASSGKQLLDFTVGEIYYFTPPKVQLPNTPTVTGHTSNLVADLGISAYAHWNVRLGEEWDPHNQHSDLSEVQLQYQPKGDRVINLGYRFRRSLLEQLDTSFVWPIKDSWNVYAREVFSIKDKQNIESLAGFQYRSCCWRLGVLMRHYVSNQTGTQDTAITLQFELNGLSSVGEQSDAFLARSIRGYSSTASENSTE
jgi:LPS-assembly protein